MPISSRFQSTALVALQLAAVAYADLYLHFPPGANDRNRERNENRNNGNRLYDTQNNDKGGYPWNGNRELQSTWDGYKFYAGSVIRFEWTAQHGMGPDGGTDGHVIIQYSCNKLTGLTSEADFAAADPDWKYHANVGSPDLIPRDGYPTGDLAESDADNPGQYKQATFTSNGQNADGTNTMQCPAGTGCPAPNFGDTTLDSNAPSAWTDFYDKLTVVNGFKAVEFGYHETFQHYQRQCIRTLRNRGLYTADQQLGGNSARFTRQNPNGNRDGFECPEERDYYPYWQPTPWRDVAILVSHSQNWRAQCDYYQSNSQNKASRGYCRATDMTAFLTSTDNPLFPIDEANCTKATGYTGKWVTWPAWGLAAPDCLLHPISRENQLGNTIRVEQTRAGSSYSPAAEFPHAAGYEWTVPESLSGKHCVFRVRYNMSSSDYPQSNWNSNNFKESIKSGTTSLNNSDSRAATFWNSRFNCPGNTDDLAMAEIYNPTLKEACQNKIDDATNFVPLFNRPYVKVASDDKYPLLAIAFNTNQVSRTFQDRTYVINFATFASRGTKKIVNLNMRGRRGNIVQCYPSVENDFYPPQLSLTNDDLVHIQFCGSDFNPNNNPNNGEGWRFSTRMNMIAIRDGMMNMPKKIASGPLFGDTDLANRLAFADIKTDTSTCVSFQGNNGNSANNNITNCAKLNPSKACIDYGVHSIPAGAYSYVATRNNNFSNRSNRGSMNVADAGKWTQAQVAGAATGGVIGAVALVAAGIIFYAKKNPNSKVATMLTKRYGGTATSL